MPSRTLGAVLLIQAALYACLSIFTMVAALETRQVVVTALNIRAAPSLYGPIVSTYSMCEVISMVERCAPSGGYNWIKVLYKGSYRYVATGLVAGGDVHVAYYPATACVPSLKMRLPVDHGKEAGYTTDTGLDINVPVGTPVLAAASGVIVYSEYGHTSWTTPPDTPNSILIKLDKPFTYAGRTAYYIWYTHLSSLVYSVKDGTPPTKRVMAGALLGKSGLGNRSAHLHFGIIINRAQRNAADYFNMTQVREALGLQAGQQF